MPSVRTCPQCEQPLPDEPRRMGRPRTYCSVGCRKAYHDRKYRLKQLEAKRLSAPKSDMPTPEPVGIQTPKVEADGLPPDPPIPGEEIIEPVSCMCLVCAVRFDLPGFQRTYSCCRRAAARLALCDTSPQPQPIEAFAAVRTDWM